MPGPNDPNVLPPLSPAERIQHDIGFVETAAHMNDPRPHDPATEQIFFNSQVDGKPVEVYIDYEHPDFHLSDQIRLQIVYPEGPQRESESYMFDPTDSDDDQTVALGSLPDSGLQGAEATKRMADRFDEVLAFASNAKFTFLDEEQ